MPVASRAKNAKSKRLAGAVGLLRLQVCRDEMRILFAEFSKLHAMRNLQTICGAAPIATILAASE
jgi:hypothetical protein